MCDVCASAESGGGGGGGGGSSRAGKMQEQQEQEHCIDATEESKHLIRILRQCSATDTKVTLLQAVTHWRNGGSKVMPAGKAMPSLSKASTRLFSSEFCEIAIVRLVLEGYLKEEFGYTAFSTNSYLKVNEGGSLVSRLMASGSKARVSLLLLPPTWSGSGVSVVSNPKGAKATKPTPAKKRKTVATEGARKSKDAVIDLCINGDSDDDDFQ
jgi:hypothetical protein